MDKKSENLDFKETCGRLGGDFDSSKNICNIPFPKPNPKMVRRAFNVIDGAVNVFGETDSTRAFQDKLDGMHSTVLNALAIRVMRSVAKKQEWDKRIYGKVREAAKDIAPMKTMMV